jgi:predicted aspartyl protease
MPGDDSIPCGINESGHILIPVSLDGKQVTAGLDTGWGSFSVILRDTNQYAVNRTISTQTETFLGIYSGEYTTFFRR